MSDQINTPISPGELIDKITILEIKKEFIIDSNKLKNINMALWGKEDEKRSCEKNSDFGDKFIKVSRDIHFFNDDRAKIKLEINNHTGSKIKEIKEYTNY